MIEPPPHTCGARVKVEVPTTDTAVKACGTSTSTVSNPVSGAVPVHPVAVVSFVSTVRVVPKPPLMVHVTPPTWVPPSISTSCTGTEPGQGHTSSFWTLIRASEKIRPVPMREFEPRTVKSRPSSPKGGKFTISQGGGNPHTPVCSLDEPTGTGLGLPL